MVRTAEKIILYKDAAPMITPFSMPITVGIYQDLTITITELLK